MTPIANQNVDQNKGQLYYLIGASGSGKDSLISAARAQAMPEDKVLFAHRYITRAANAGGENHIALNQVEFELRQQSGFFLFDWQAHGNRYGIGIEVEHWLAAGFDVVMNGSRAYLKQARARLPQLVAVGVVVDQAVVDQRLATRGREGADDISARAQRNTELGASEQLLDAEINNNQALTQSADELLALIRSR